MALFSSEIVVDGEISSSDARLKWEQAARENAKAAVKGKTFFLHSKKDGKYVLHYYQSYGKDFCDTMFAGEIYEYDEGQSQITGKISVSKGMKKFAFALIACSLPLALLFNLILYYTVPFLERHFNLSVGLNETPYGGIFTFACAALVFIVLGIMSLMVDKRKVKVVMDYLHGFLQKQEQE